MDQTFVDAASAIDTPIVGFTEIPGSGSRLPEYLGEARTTLGRDAQPVAPSTTSTWRGSPRCGPT